MYDFLLVGVAYLVASGIIGNIDWLFLKGKIGVNLSTILPWNKS